MWSPSIPFHQLIPFLIIQFLQMLPPRNIKRVTQICSLNVLAFPWPDSHSNFLKQFILLRLILFPGGGSLFAPYLYAKHSLSHAFFTNALDLFHIFALKLFALLSTDVRCWHLSLINNTGSTWLLLLSHFSRVRLCATP